MKSLIESLFDSDLVSKQSDDMIRLDVQNQLQKIAKSNPEISWRVENNRDGSISNIICIKHDVYPADTSVCPKCSFAVIFEAVFEKDLKLYVYLPVIHFFIEAPDKLQRNYNNYTPLSIKPRPPYIKSFGERDIKPLSMRSSREMSFLYNDLKQIINNFYNKETLRLMQIYADTYMETGKRPTPIMNKIAGNVCKIYSKFNY